jgi:hypothetical protein
MLSLIYIKPTWIRNHTDAEGEVFNINFQGNILSGDDMCMKI